MVYMPISHPLSVAGCSRLHWRQRRGGISTHGHKQSWQAGLWAVWVSHGKKMALPFPGRVLVPLPGLGKKTVSWRSGGAVWGGNGQALMSSHTDLGSTSSV